jgi:hypothetical protein
VHEKLIILTGFVYDIHAEKAYFMVMFSIREVGRIENNRLIRWNELGIIK